jgi:hypothetical protein
MILLYSCVAEAAIYEVGWYLHMHTLLGEEILKVPEHGIVVEPSEVGVLVRGSGRGHQ